MQEPVLTPPQRKLFDSLIWEIARMVPAGKVTSYGQIAGFIPAPDGIDPAAYAAFRARWAGSSMKASPADVPWQRVINAQGKLSLPPESRAYAEQRRLLEEEGILFDERDRVDMQRFGWSGPSKEWLEAHGLQAPGPSFSQGKLPI